MTDRRLKGAPTSADLGLTGKRAMVYEATMTNYHEGQARMKVLAECKCAQITADVVEPGDFRYHYSTQLDAFILWEVVTVDRERMVCEVRTIDSDTSDVSTYWDGEQTLVDGFNKFYRPDPTDRARVERAGFESAYIPFMPGMKEPARRHLTVRLHRITSERIERMRTEPAQPAPEYTLLEKIGRWFLGH